MLIVLFLPPQSSPPIAPSIPPQDFSHKTESRTICSPRPARDQRPACPMEHNEWLNNIKKSSYAQTHARSAQKAITARRIAIPRLQHHHSGLIAEEGPPDTPPVSSLQSSSDLNDHSDLSFVVSTAYASGWLAWMVLLTMDHHRIQAAAETAPEIRQEP